MQRYLFVLFCFLLAGCGSVPMASNDLTVDRLKGNALVILSVTNNNAAYMGGANQFPPRLMAVNVSTGDKVDFDGIGGVRLKNAAGSWPMGAVIAKELPAGTYEINNFHTPAVAYHVMVTPKDMPSIRFTLEPDTATYIGNINFRAYEGNRYTLLVSDQRERDIDLFSRNWPAIDLGSIRYRFAQGRQ